MCRRPRRISCCWIWGCPTWTALTSAAPSGTLQVPIIVVSARGEEIDRVVVLEMGADDYVVKPFGMHELVARIRAVARRPSRLMVTPTRPPPPARSVR